MIGTEIEINVGVLLLFVGVTTLVLFLIQAILKIVWGRKDKKAADFSTALVVVAADYAEIFLKGFGEQMGFSVTPKGKNQNGDQCVEINTKEFDEKSIEFLIELKVLKENQQRENFGI